MALPAPLHAPIIKPPRSGQYTSDDGANVPMSRENLGLKIQHDHEDGVHDKSPIGNCPDCQDQGSMIDRMVHQSRNGNFTQGSMD